MSFKAFTAQLAKIDSKDVQAKYLAKASSVLHDATAERQLAEYTKELVEIEKQEASEKAAQKPVEVPKKVEPTPPANTQPPKAVGPVPSVTPNKP